MSLLTLLSFVLVVSAITCKNLDQQKGRLFGKSYTSTIKETKIVTELVPSSCVQVDATLPPCRNVRYLKFPNIDIKGKLNQHLNFFKTESSVNKTPLGWGEYLGIYAPTITVTQTEIETTTVQDPGIVVTFAVKGCKPLKLPLELELCPNEQVVIEEILPTSTISATIEPTSSLAEENFHEDLQNINYLNLGNNEGFQNAIEASTEGLGEGVGSLQPTEALKINTTTTIS